MKLIVPLYLLLFINVGAQQKQPNILFLFTDDQRHDTIQALGNEQIKTPHIDSLVKSGTAFTNAYIMGASSPAVCSPSRACLMSGRTIWNIESQGIWAFNVSNKYKSLPQVFREGGYESFGTGKQHNGKGSYARSFSTGASIFFGGMSNQYRLSLNKFDPAGKYGRDTSFKSNGKHSAEVYADATIEFIKSQAKSEKPFFAYVAFQTPHDPRQAPKKYIDMYKDNVTLPVSFKPKHPFDNGMLKIRDEGLAKFPRKEKEILKHLGDYYGMVTHTDAQIGRILAALKESGKFENTIIVFSSDNGLSVGRHGLLGKQNIYDHAVHVPLVISGPGIPQGTTRQQLCYIYDIYPTLCERVGLKVPATVEYKSLNKVIEDPKAKFRDHLYFAFMSWQRGLQDERYKLIEYAVKKKRTTQLFDLKNDPQELNNLAANPEYASKLKGLRMKLQEQRKLLNDGNGESKFGNRQGKEFWTTFESVKETATP